MESGLDLRFAERFDLAEHLWKNQTPVCAYAVPRSLIETFKLRFDEEFAVLEDWEFFLRCVALAPVEETGKLTSIVQIWLEGLVPVRALLATVEGAGADAAERMNLRPLVLPPGSVMSLVELRERCAEAEAALSGLAGQARHAAGLGKLIRMAAAYEEVSQMYTEVVTSERWRVLGPPARAVNVSASAQEGRPETGGGLTGLAPPPRLLGIVQAVDAVPDAYIAPLWAKWRPAGGPGAGLSIRPRPR